MALRWIFSAVRRSWETLLCVEYEGRLAVEEMRRDHAGWVVSRSGEGEGEPLGDTGKAGLFAGL
jgi:hypothetical protein